MADVCAIACELFGSVGSGGAQLLFAMFGFTSGCPPLAPYAGLLGATLYGFGVYWFGLLGAAFIGTVFCGGQPCCAIIVPA